MPGITDPNQEYFKDGTWHWDGTEWRKGGLAFEYAGQVLDSEIVASAPAGSNTLQGEAVPTGYIWVITAMQVFDSIHGVSSALLGVDSGGTSYWLAATGALAILEGFSWSGSMYLVAGDKPQAVLKGVTLNDYLYFAYAGYAMRLT